MRWQLTKVCGVEIGGGGCFHVWEEQHGGGREVGLSASTKDTLRACSASEYRLRCRIGHQGPFHVGFMALFYIPRLTCCSIGGWSLFGPLLLDSKSVVLCLLFFRLNTERKWFRGLFSWSATGQRGGMDGCEGEDSG